MRRRLILLAAAVTLMVALAFVVPLAFLVRDLAADRAIAAGERRAQDVARIIAALAPERGVEVASQAVLLGESDGLEASLVMPDGTVIGAPLVEGEVPDLALAGTAFRTDVAGGDVIYTPVIQPDGSTLVVRVLVPDGQIRQGVASSWAVLAIVGAALVVFGAIAADLLGRSIVKPVKDLADTAEKLGEGDMGVRVEPAGPEEIHDVGVEFNRLAGRFGRLLQQERDTAADLSHRLRTPLTSLRLNVDGLPDGPERQRVLDDLDNVERTIDFIIRQALRPVDELATTDLRQVVAERVAFWAALAEEQQRSFTADLADERALVGWSQADAEAVIDVLFDNVFTHVPPAAPIAVALVTNGSSVALSVEDGGSGFPDDSVVERGISGGTSTGLGLDIVRRSAEGANGSVVFDKSPDLGGARVIVRLPLIATPR
ncbi:MAG TPA: HAMP domain-containing sensor histidine kinase [Acidimicrobiia bacterium]|jgi:signal transduction histidine kinase|nr:HAMP domain-containing sensor histidine kinase [Acidimicrobiia bacterium]